MNGLFFASQWRQQPYDWNHPHRIATDHRPGFRVSNSPETPMVISLVTQTGNFPHTQLTKFPRYPGTVSFYKTTQGTNPRVP